MSRDVFLVDGLRSPIGKFGGSLRSLRATDVASTVTDALFDRIGLDRGAVDLITAGMVLQDMTESNPARIVGMRCHLPDRVAAFTVNMQCCSSMSALLLGGRQVAAGAADVVLTVGLESMSNSSHWVPGSRWGHRYGHGDFLDMLSECTFAGSKMWKEPNDMIGVAQHHAEVDGISRTEMDEYALVTHRRAVAAAEAGRFDNEIVPIPVPGREEMFTVDENPRPDSTLEILAKLPPVRPGGVITAGNSASLNDGAAAAVLASGEAVERHGLEPLARIMLEGSAMVGCDPNLMGYSCVTALEKALDGAGKTVADLDLIECNEGFAVQLVACQRMAGWPRETLNVDGGSVALGHPVGMSGLRITIHLAKSLRQRGLSLGGATIPAGSGLGTAVLVEAVA